MQVENVISLQWMFGISLYVWWVDIQHEWETFGIYRVECGISYPIDEKTGVSVLDLSSLDSSGANLTWLFQCQWNPAPSVASLNSQTSGVAKPVLSHDGCRHKNKADVVFLLNPAFLFILLVSLKNITSNVYPIAAPSMGTHANTCFKIAERLPTRLLCDKNWMNPQRRLRTLHDFWARSSVSSFKSSVLLTDAAGYYYRLANNQLTTKGSIYYVIRGFLWYWLLSSVYGFSFCSCEILLHMYWLNY